MSDATPSNRKQQNRILSALPHDEYERMLPHLVHVEMTKGKVLFEPDEHISYVYFPYSGTVSISAVLQNGSEVEVGVVGREGMVGLPRLLGTDTAPLKALVQLEGDGVKMKAEAFNAETVRCGELYQLLLRYTQAFFVSAAMTAACNRLHKIDERLARWMLTCEDRAQSNELRMTQEFLAIMLGTRRAGVTEAAGRLQAEGLIEYKRGVIHIINRRGLEKSSCECYDIVRKEFDRLLRG